MKQKIAFCLIITIFCGLWQPAMADTQRNVKTFRIATARPGGTYFSMGALIAHALSRSEGARPCEKGGSCGVTGLQAVALSSAGSVDNINMLRAGKVEAVIAQADAAFLAYHGQREFENTPPFEGLRAIAYLWPESLHLLSPGTKPISLPQYDLKGKNISLGLQGSGSLLGSLQILDAVNLSVDQDFIPHYLGISDTISLLSQYELDAGLVLGGWPLPSIKVARDNKRLEINDIPEGLIAQLEKKYPWFTHQEIPKNVYNTQDDIHTVGVYSLLLVRADMPKELIYDITAALWDENNAQIYQRGFQGQDLMQLARQQEEFIVPLHEGAKAWYDAFLDKSIEKDSK